VHHLHPHFDGASKQ
jgi:hypothetical protein